MKRLTWVQPEDLLAHELVAAAEEGKDVGHVRRRWEQAGGDPAAPIGGVGPGPAGPLLRALAELLIDELAQLPADVGLTAREPTELADIERSWPQTPARLQLPDQGELADRIHGAWLGRAAGCLLGKPVERLPREGIRAVLQATGDWPLDDFFTGQGLPDDVAKAWPWNRRSAPTVCERTSPACLRTMT